MPIKHARIGHHGFLGGKKIPRFEKFESNTITTRPLEIVPRNNILIDPYIEMFKTRDMIVCVFFFSLFRSFGTVCSKCSKGISASHWVRKARDHVYHLACFRCDACDRQLNTGEEFALHEGRVLCKPHYLDIVDGGTTSSSGILPVTLKEKRSRIVLVCSIRQC